MAEVEDLPPEIAKQLMSFLREVDGEFEVVDMFGLVQFIARNGDRYPVLYNLVKVNGNALIEHHQNTGEVLPGTKLIHTTTEEGSNVTRVEILRGPIPPKR